MLFGNLAGNTFYGVANDLLPFMVGQSHDSFTLLNIKDVTLFRIVAMSAGHSCAVARGTDWRHSESEGNRSVT
jgi:hypothetical protein